jgi:hypothetical protein
MKVKMYGDTCEGPCVAEQSTKNTIQPGFPGLFRTLTAMWVEKYAYFLFVLGFHPRTMSSSDRQNGCFSFLTMYVELYFHTR